MQSQTQDTLTLPMISRDAIHTGKVENILGNNEVDLPVLKIIATKARTN